MRRDLLVTLADKNYTNQAKQLFSSVYFNAGWKGDYMLLSYEIPEEDLKWFRDKGILIKRCEPIYHEESNLRLAIMLLKFYLFTPEFKRWKNVVFLDADTIVRASLDDLTRIKGLAAVRDSSFCKLRHQFINSEKMNRKLFTALDKNYSLKQSAFNVGVMVFSTNIITKESFFKLKRLFETYREVIYPPEQAIFNLFFYKKWIKLPLIYNLSPYHATKAYNIKPEKLKGIILHFPGPKPWDVKDIFYKEWRHNFGKSDLIDLNNIPTAAKTWSESEIKKYCSYLERKHMIFILDRYIGIIGTFLKNNFPKLYSALRKLKNGK